VAKQPVRPWIVFAILCTTFFMLLLDFSIVSVALPAIGKGLAAGPERTQWLISAYSIVFAGFLLFAGRCADVYGRRAAFFAGLAIFTIASLVAGLAQNAELLVVMRAVQGLGAAIVNPAALAIAMGSFADRAERSRAIGLWGIAGSAGIVVGMFLGGALVALFGWRSVFFVNVPVGVLIFLLAAALLPREARAPGTRGLDARGALLLTAALLLLTYAIVQAPSDGFLSRDSIVRFVLAAVLFAGYIMSERRSDDPLIPAHILRIEDFTPSAVLSLVQAAAYGSVYVYASAYFQDVAHLSPLATGIAFIPATLVMACVSGPLSAPLARRFGARAISVFGAIFMIGGSYLLLALSRPGIPPLSGVLPATILAGFGCMFTYEISMIAGLASVEDEDEALASAAISTASQIGLSLGVAAAAAFAIAFGAVHFAFWSSIIFSVLSLGASLAIRGGSRTSVRHFHFGKLVFRGRSLRSET
jgi:EmrB/QacA subfamily drug resistance transporter